MTDNVLPFPGLRLVKKEDERLHPDGVSILMLEAAMEEANKYGYKLKNNPEVMLDFEYILKLICASVSRDGNIDHPYQAILEEATGMNQGTD